MSTLDACRKLPKSIFSALSANLLTAACRKPYIVSFRQSAVGTADNESKNTKRFSAGNHPMTKTLEIYDQNQKGNQP